MLKFSCQCGKQYQLPDRTAGREVRCNQCQRTLVVPDSSRDEPVVPRDDAPRDEEKTEDVPPVGEPQPPEAPRRKTPLLAIPIVLVLCAGAFAAGYSLRNSPENGAPVAKPAEPIAETETADLSKTPHVHEETLKIEAETVMNELATSLKFPASEAAEAVKDADKDKRIAAMKTLSERRGKALADWNAAFRKQQTAEFLASLPELSTLTLPAIETPVGDWKVNDQIPISFAVRTADGAPALVSSDGNPAEKKKDGNTLDDIAAAFAEDDHQSDAQMQTATFRNDSGSSQGVRLIWPATGEASLEGGKIKEFRFSLYLSEKGNAIFKPGKPEGIDRVLECSSIVLRLSSDTGFVEFVPANNDALAALVQQARRGWAPQRIPVKGDDAWKRNDYGLIGPLVVRRIELIVRPTGEGVTFWVDNLGIGR